MKPLPIGLAKPTYPLIAPLLSCPIGRCIHSFRISSYHGSLQPLPTVYERQAIQRPPHLNPCHGNGQGIWVGVKVEFVDYVVRHIVQILEVWWYYVGLQHHCDLKSMFNNVNAWKLGKETTLPATFRAQS